MLKAALLAVKAELTMLMLSNFPMGRKKMDVLRGQVL
jgi:hypothetical protein